MIKVIHSFEKESIQKETEEDVSFIITNKKGGYCYLSNKAASRYQGIFFNDNFKMYKVVDSIKTEGEVKEIKNNFYNIERRKKNFTERFFMPYGYNSLVYELSKQNEIELILDVRESYNHPEFGRNYEINEEKNKVIVKYNQESEFQCYIVVSGYKSFEKTTQWFKQFYEEDKERNSLPYENFVFSALKLNSEKIIITFSKDKEKAIKENEFISNNLEILKKRQKENIKDLFKAIKINKQETKFAYYCSLRQLNELLVDIKGKIGIYAGLPWFFQFWTRDELISAKALLIMKKYYEVNKIISKNFYHIIKNGLVNKFPDSNFIAADAVGWLCNLIGIKNKHIRINKKLIKKIENFALYNIHKNSEDNFIKNNARETWMDSLDRTGVRIEIQALWLNIFRLLYIMTKKNKYLIYEHKLGKKIREKMWNGKYFADGLDDWTIRPNIFIAAYVYPKLLNEHEWSRCFERILHNLWLDYGGLSTIDKSSEFFHSTYTGENNLSYHNGDSWFYLNNMAALVLYKNNKKKFKKYINKIVNASTEEILWKGAVGCHSEISSANKLESKGCLSQAWSSALFIELINELY